MNPHIGQTLHQRAVLRRYLARDHAAEQERFEQIHAQLQVDALLDRVKQPEPCQFCAPDDGAAETNRARWFLVIVLFVGYPLAAWVIHLPAVSAFIRSIP